MRNCDQGLKVVPFGPFAREAESPVGSLERQALPCVDDQLH